MYVCIECGQTFADKRLAGLHTVNPPTKSGPGKPRVRHHIFEQTSVGGGAHTASAPAGQSAVPLRECGTPPTFTEVPASTQGPRERCTYDGIALAITADGRVVP